MVITGKTGAAVLIVLLALPKLFQNHPDLFRHRPSGETDISRMDPGLILSLCPFCITASLFSFLLGLILDVFFYGEGIQFDRIPAFSRFDVLLLPAQDVGAGLVTLRMARIFTERF